MTSVCLVPAASTSRQERCNFGTSSVPEEIS
jgi:hypothetical protein